MRFAILALTLFACGPGAVGTPPDAGGNPDGGPAPAALCPVPPMDQLYTDIFPPNPYGAVLAADDCVATVHDAVLVLGCPTELDGGPSDCQTKRADIAASLQPYAANFIVSGGAAHNQFVEADSLQTLLLARGIPADHIFEDRKANHTDENIYYGTRIMQAQGWQSALVVSEDPGQLIYEAVCDSNCCVDLGRLTAVALPGGLKVGHYALFPEAADFAAAECAQIEKKTKFMCTKLSSRLSCKSSFRLPP